MEGDFIRNIIRLNKIGIARGFWGMLAGVMLMQAVWINQHMESRLEWDSANQYTVSPNIIHLKGDFLPAQSSIDVSVPPDPILQEKEITGPEEEPQKKHRYAAIEQTISQEEIDLLAKIVWIESRGEPNEGQQGVVEVICNRALSGQFPSSIREVIFAPGQFTSVDYLDTAQPTQKEYDNIALVLSGETAILAQDVVYFSREPLNDRIYTQIGNHYFCRV